MAFYLALKRFPMAFYRLSTDQGLLIQWQSYTFAPFLECCPVAERCFQDRPHSSVG